MPSRASYHDSNDGFTLNTLNVTLAITLPSRDPPNGAQIRFTTNPLPQSREVEESGRVDTTPPPIPLITFNQRLARFNLKITSLFSLSTACYHYIPFC